MPYSYLTHLECPRCSRQHDADVLQNLCGCGSPLLARYDLAAVKSKLAPADLTGRPACLWRYHELLPVRDEQHVVSLGEGMTPLVPLPRLGESMGLPGLLMKDEGLIPTGTFKARGAAVGVSRAAELGVRKIAMPTNGNAGAAWATYAARAGLGSLIVMPQDAPSITRAECAVAGAELFLVRGLIGDAGQMVGQAVAAAGGRYFDASTLKEPYRLEGKKTMGLELAEQLGWRCPDVILYPTGGGVGLIGIHKALKELQELGWIGAELPRLVAVQASGCAPIVRAFNEGSRSAEAWPNPHTVAFGITVAKALGDFLILDALYDTRGTAIAVDDADLLAEQSQCARTEGVFMCPEGAATLAAARQLRRNGWLRESEQVVVLNTGTGLIYPETVTVTATTLDVGDALPVN
jgi:threonine synthase